MAVPTLSQSECTCLIWVEASCSKSFSIVFIHGLRGHRVQTWTHVSNNIQVFWPEALLRHDIELSRIITFGYDADVINSWSKVGQGSLRTHAESLVNELKLLRQDTQTEHRAILFVAHSLGGLVFKEVWCISKLHFVELIEFKAMLISSGNPVDAIRMVYEKTAGACFLGVPHQGSELANGFFLNFLLNAAGFVKTTNKKTIALLQPQSEVLARVEDDFDNLLLRRASLGPPLQIQSFYETVPITGIGIVSRPPFSGIKYLSYVVSRRSSLSGPLKGTVPACPYPLMGITWKWSSSGAIRTRAIFA